jgi:hypothetical protein
MADPSGIMQPRHRGAYRLTMNRPIIEWLMQPGAPERPTLDDFLGRPLLAR